MLVLIGKTKINKKENNLPEKQIITDIHHLFKI
jgi:hypothetical protein